MHINWTTLALQTINVLVLVWLLSRFFYKPIVAAIAARQTAADGMLADAEAARVAATAQDVALKASNHDFAADLERRRAAAQANVDADRTRLLDQARQEIADLHTRADSAEKDERKRTGAALEAQAAILAGHMADKLLARLPVAAVTEAMFQALVDRLATLSAQDRDRLAADQLQVVTPQPLGPDETRYAKALAAALPGMPQPTFSVDPTLIAGFELHNAQMVLRNSWRADLDALLANVEGAQGNARIG